jgi:hypothetical protein
MPRFVVTKEWNNRDRTRHHFLFITEKNILNPPIIISRKYKKNKNKIISQSQDLRKKKVKVGKEIKAFSRIRKQSSMEYRKAREWILTDPIGVQNLLRYRSCFFL